jgi:glycosyltransferase involved in cell wall biosynthesis
MLDSILSQTFAEFEVIISDNASTDRTRTICEQYAQRDARVRLYGNDRNRGASWNYGRVFELARGKYFRWAAADDLFGAESLEACVDVLEKHPDAALCYPTTTLIDAEGQTIRRHDENLDLRMESPTKRFIACLKQLGMGNVIYGLMRSEMVRRTRLIGNFPGADLIFIPELSIYGKFIEIDRPLFFRRMHQGSSSSLKTVEEIQNFFDPATKGRAFARYAVHCSEHLRSVLRSPLKIHDKGRLLLFLCRGMVASRDVLIGELFSSLRTKLYDKPRL